MVNLVINTAVDGATNRAERVGREINKSVSRLSSGSTIANPGDNVAAMAVGSRFATSVVAQNVINTNISTGVSAAQTADGAYAQTLEMLTRMKVLSLSATSENLSNTERALIDGEYQALLEEIDRIAKDTQFNGVKLAETGVIPIFAGSNFTDASLPVDSFIPELNSTDSSGGTNTAEIADGVLRLIDTTDGNNIRGVFVNDKEFILEAGLEAEFVLEAGLPSVADVDMGVANPADTSFTRIGGGFSFFLFDAEAVDFSGDVEPQLGDNNAANLLFFDSAGTVVADGGFLAVGVSSTGGFGGVSAADSVSVAGPGGVIVNQAITPTLDGTGTLVANVEQNIFRINLTISEDLLLNLTFTNVADDAVQNVIEDLDLTAFNTPDALKFGFGATTAGRENRFAVDEFSVLAAGDVSQRMDEAAARFKATTSTNASDQELLLPLFDATVEGLTLEQTNIRTKDAAEFAIERLEFALEQTVEARAVVGAALSRFEGARDFLSTKILNLEAARSGLTDLNVAEEISNLTALRIQNSAGVGVIQDGQQLLRNTVRLLQSAEGVNLLL